MTTSAHLSQPGDLPKVAWFRFLRSTPFNSAWLSLFTAALLAAQDNPLPTSGDSPDPVPTPIALSPWDNSFILSSGVGYKDNVLLSAINRQQSPFIATGLEAFFIRIPEGNTDFHFFVAGDDIRYLGPAPVDHEQTLINRAEWKTRTTWGQVRFALQHFYQNQVFDLSATEDNLQSILARGHNLSVLPGLRFNLGSAGWIEGAFAVRRQFILEPLDDYWEGGPELRLGRTYGYRSELSLGYLLNNRHYDSRTQLDADGFSLPEEPLEFHQHKTELAWKHHWDERRRVRTSFKAGLEWNLDNGPGYFDYLRSRLTLSHRQVSAPWTVEGAVNFSRYEYSVQTVNLGGDSPHNRERNELTLTLRLERSLTSHLKAVGSLESDTYFSNEILDTYRVNTILTGLEWEF